MKRVFLCLGLGLALLAGAVIYGGMTGPQPALAASKGIVRVKTKDKQTLELYQGSHALVIGAGRYGRGWSRLDSVPGETEQVVRALEEKGFQVTKVSDPDHAALKQAFEDFIDKYGYQPGNRLLFFFSGHGATLKGPGGNQGYLVPVDASRPDRDQIDFLRKALPMTQVLAWCRNMHAKHALFLFDSCFSGTVLKSKSSPAPRYISKKTAKPVRQFISAGSAIVMTQGQGRFCIMGDRHER